AAPRCAPRCAAARRRGRGRVRRGRGASLRSIPLRRPGRPATPALRLHRPPSSPPPETFRRRAAIMRIMLNSEPAPVVLAADDVPFAYGAGGALDRGGLEVRAGEFAALAGPNGSGKSTLLRTLLGLLPPQTGSVQVFGVAPSDLRDRWRVGYVPQ